LSSSFGSLRLKPQLSSPPRVRETAQVGGMGMPQKIHSLQTLTPLSHQIRATTEELVISELQEMNDR
jgi:hypothetical protein